MNGKCRFLATPAGARLRTCLRLFAVVLGVCLPASAQRQLFHAYGAADGLNNLNVRCLFQDQTGFIWVGTDNGLFRYDGGHFRSYGHADGLSDTEILSIAQSPDGRLWVGTNSGLSVLVREKFKTIDLGDPATVRTIGFDSAGVMYLSHEDDIERGSPDTSGAYSFRVMATGAVSSLSVGQDEVYFGKDADLWRLRGETAERVGGRLGLPSDHWGSTLLDTLGNRWVRSASRLYELPHGQSRFIDRSSWIPRSSDTRLFADRHGNIFIPTLAGILSVNESHRTLLDVQHGLPAYPSGPMLIDREDLLWVGTEGAGLVRRLGHGEWSAWTENDGLVRNGVWSVASDRAGGVWVGTDGGLTIFDRSGQRRRSWTSHSGLTGDRVVSLLRTPDEHFYAGTDAGAISEFSPAGDLLRTYRKPSTALGDRIDAMAIDHEARLWAVGPGGCFRSTPVGAGKPLLFEHMTVRGISDQSAFRSVAVSDDDTVWVASNRGLHRFTNGAWKTYTQRDGLRSQNLGVVTQTSDGIAIAYRDALGMALLKQNNAGLGLRDITTADGLQSDAVYAIATDHKGRMWVATDRGTDVLKDGVWSHFGSENGLIWNDTDSLALHVDASDNVWIGTSGGLSRYSQPDFPPTDNSARIVLTSITGVTEQWQPGEEPVLPYASRSITIQYAALTYEAGSALRFRYRLNGFEPGWNETTERSVHFAALPAGRYTFEVEYATGNNTWSDLPARFTFTISKPWWARWWFIGSCVIALVMVGAALTRIRLRRLEAQKKELEHQVADRTAELVTSHRQLEEIAYFDMLTSTPNRRMFVEEFRKRALGGHEAQAFTLLLIDLDHFKYINDTFGHDAGDLVLMAAAARLRSRVQHSDFVARLGGDEFAVLLFSSTTQAQIEETCRQILAALSMPVVHHDALLKVGCSIGIAQFPSDAESQESLYKAADLALYQAKHAGRNTFCWYSQKGQKATPVSADEISCPA